MIRNIHEGSRFDSTLDLGNNPRHYANLYIHMKVCLQQFNPPEGHAILQYEQSMAGTTSDIIISGWPRGSEWGDWCRQFERVAEEFFDAKFWLVPSGSWLGTITGPGSNGQVNYNRSVHCKFRISRVSMDECHCIADVAYTHTQSESFRSHRYSTNIVNESVLAGVSDWDDDPENLATVYRACFAGNGRLMLDNRDLAFGQYLRYGEQTEQRAFLHEIGHALGLPHVNDRGGPRKGDAYGRNHDQSGDLMGAGERLEPWHAEPWQTRMNLHLSPIERPVQWSATTSRPQITRERHYPGNNHPSNSGVAGSGSQDGGIATRCSARGCSQHGPEGTEA